MSRILTATYTDGKLILNEKLESSLEGKTVEFTLHEPAESMSRIEIWAREKTFIQSLNRSSEGRDWKREDLYDRFEN